MRKRRNPYTALLGVGDGLWAGATPPGVWGSPPELSLESPTEARRQIIFSLFQTFNTIVTR